MCLAPGLGSLAPVAAAGDMSRLMDPAAAGGEAGAGGEYARLFRRAPWRPARHIVSMGETYDFEFVPEGRGNLRLEVRQLGPAGRLLVRAPIRVE